jgi:hypothetical protein
VYSAAVSIRRVANSGFLAAAALLMSGCYITREELPVIRYDVTVASPDPASLCDQATRIIVSETPLKRDPPPPHGWGRGAPSCFLTFSGPDHDWLTFSAVPQTLTLVFRHYGADPSVQESTKVLADRVLAVIRKNYPDSKIALRRVYDRCWGWMAAGCEVVE